MLLFFILSSTANAILIDRIVAVVEDDVITESELQKRINVIMKQYKNNPDALPPNDVLIDQVLQKLIIERLQLQLAERRGIQIDELTLDQAMRNLAKRNNMSLEQFREALLSEGLDYVIFRNQIRTDMVIEQLRRRAVDQQIQVTDVEVDELVTRSDEELLRKEYEYKIAHILIAIPENPNPQQIEQAQRRATAVYERAISGNNFSKLAIAASDAQDALQGGDLGWRNNAQMPPIFLQQAVQMSPGDVSKIGQSPAGFHIFKLNDKREITDTMVTQVLCRHILIRTNALLDDDTAERKLIELKNRITNGDDFAELAKANSEDPGSAVNGGMLDWAASSSFVPKFQEVVDKLYENQISDPFKTQYGWHIVQLINKREHDSTEDAMRAEAREQIRLRKVEEETELWLRELRDTSYIEIRLHETN